MVDNLVKLARLFELRSNSFLKKSICKLGDISTQPMAPAFLSALIEYANKTIPSDILNQWIINNKNILQNLPEQTGWKFQGYFLELKQGNKVSRLTTLMDVEDAEDDLKVSQTSYFPGIPPIPDLYLIQGEPLNVTKSDYDTSILQSDPELAKDAFMVIALGKICKIYNKNIIKNYIKENSAILNEIRKFFSEIPKYLGGGADGVAFSIAPNRVLKIFKDTFAFKKAQEAMIRLHKNPSLAKTEAMIYDVGEFTVTQNGPLYFYIMEKMKPLTSFDKRVKDAVTNIVEEVERLFQEKVRLDPSIKNILPQFNDPMHQKDIKNKIKSFTQELIEKIKLKQEYVENINLINSSLNLKNNWLELLVEEILVKYLTDRDDIHIGNIGITNYGELRYFDPTYGVGPNIWRI